MNVPSEKQILLTALAAALADCDRAGLGKIGNFVADLSWPSQTKELVKGLLSAGLPIEPQHELLAAICREEMLQEQQEAQARLQEERAKQERRAEISAKQSEAAKKRHDIEAQLKTGKSAPPPSTPNADPARNARPTEPPRPASPPASQPPFTPRDRNPDNEH